MRFRRGRFDSKVPDWKTVVEGWSSPVFFGNGAADNRVALSSIPRTTTWISRPNQQEPQDVISSATKTDTPDQLWGRGVTAASLAFTQVGVGSNPTGLTDYWRVAQR